MGSAYPHLPIAAHALDPLASHENQGMSFCLLHAITEGQCLCLLWGEVMQGLIRTVLRLMSVDKDLEMADFAQPFSRSAFRTQRRAEVLLVELATHYLDQKQ